MTLHVLHQFPGADGDPWDPDVWDAAQNTGTSASDIFSTQGRIIGQGGNGVTGARHAKRVFPADCEIIASCIRVSGGVEQYNQISVRGDGLIGSALTAYYTQQSQTTFSINRRIGGSGTLIGSVAKSPGAGQKWWTRFQVYGSTVRATSWQDGTVPPAAWECSATDPNITGPGKSRLTEGNGADGVARTAYWDDYQVSDGPRLVGLDRGSNANATGASTTVVDLPAGGGIAVGNYLILRVSVDNSGTNGAAPGLVVTDARNTWTVLGPALNDPGAASTGIAGYLAYCKVVNPYSNGDDVTLTWGTGSPVAKACGIDEWAGIDLTNPIGVAAVTNSGTGTTTSTTIGPTKADQLVYVADFVEGGTADSVTSDSDTTDGVWGTLSRFGAGTTTGGATVNAQYKRVVGTASQTRSVTLSVSRDWASIAVVFNPLIHVTAGTATGSFGFAGPAAGDVKVEAAATGLFGFAGAATGNVTTSTVGTATGLFGFAGAAAGDVEVSGSATGSFGFTGTAAGTVEVQGAATGSFGFSGPADGLSGKFGSGVGAFGFSGAAGGAVARLASAAGLFGFTGAADGVRATSGSATGLFGFAGAAEGSKILEGTATGVFGFEGAARGGRLLPGVAAGDFGFEGAAGGLVEVLATALGSFGFTGSALGVVSDEILAAATGIFGFSGGAQGVRVVEATATGVFALAGLVDATVTKRAVAVGIFGFSSTATGTKQINGTAVGSFGFVGSAAGSKTVLAVAAGVFGFMGPAHGIPAHQIRGTATGLFGFGGVALGFIHLVPHGDGLSIVAAVVFPRVAAFDGFGQVPADDAFEVVR